MSLRNPILRLQPSKMTSTHSSTTLHYRLVIKESFFARGAAVDLEVEREELEDEEATEDMATSVEGVASGIGDLANVVSHEEVGVMDKRVASPTKEVIVVVIIDDNGTMVDLIDVDPNIDKEEAKSPALALEKEDEICEASASMPHCSASSDVTLHLC
ncbi:hypothetical protein B296_00018869 [Ensete ventricosum]|uniref:Uncharacterized protein n=1 Tax=Ensete ventricosum TaxID=4639 RepID=A0A427A2B3_ENSVE|nr:hypothetical protein B296_00018869 [Ensete ventricosum]